MGEGERGEGERIGEKTRMWKRETDLENCSFPKRYTFLRKCPVFIFYFFDATLFQCDLEVFFKTN